MSWLSYEATDVGSWSFVDSNEPVRNECEVIYELFHILYWTADLKSQVTSSTIFIIIIITIIITITVTIHFSLKQSSEFVY